MTNLRTATTLGLLALFAFSATSPATAQDQKKKKGWQQANRTPEERREQYEQLFERLDKNRNNSLVMDELPEKQGIHWLNRFDRNGDDEIKKGEYMQVVDRGPGLDRLFIVRDTRARANNARNQFDQDKDGFVTAEEYPGNKNVFKKADRNRDGKLEWKELVKLANDELDDIRKKMKSPSRYDFLNLFDLNRDNKVTPAEYDGPGRSMRKFDTDGDGTVTYAELYPERMMDMEARKPPAENLNVVAALDANEDGKVSRDEFKGTPAAWKRLDRNKDGWITSADAR